MSKKYLGRENKAKQLGVSRQRLFQMQNEGKIEPEVMIDDISGFSVEQQPIKRQERKKKLSN